MLFTALVSIASAGEIQVVTATPVMVVVDGQTLEYPEGSTTVTATNLAGGAHTVTIRNLFGKEITTTNLDVPADEQLRLRYAKKELSVLGSGALPEQPATIIVQGGAPAGIASTITVDDGTDKVQITAGAGMVQTTHRRGQAAVPNGSLAPMAPGAVASLRASMADASFSKDRLELLQTAARHNWFTVSQLAQLLATFDFDNKRLDGAKLAAHRVVDPQNAHLIEGVFEFSHNGREALALFQ